MSIHFYPVNSYEIHCDDYRVKINGIESATDTARVSAFPINRRWPGHQRDKSQTELINFVRMQADEPLDIEVLTKSPFETVNIRPLGSAANVETADGKIRFRLEKPGFYTVEPYGRHRALHLFIDPVKDYEIDRYAENVIYYGPGIHEAGSIELKSGQVLFLDEGALVYGGVRALDAENIKILGRGFKGH